MTGEHGLDGRRCAVEGRHLGSSSELKVSETPSRPVPPGSWASLSGSERLAVLYGAFKRRELIRSFRDLCATFHLYLHPHLYPGSPSHPTLYALSIECSFPTSTSNATQQRVDQPEENHQSSRVTPQTLRPLRLRLVTRIRFPSPPFPSPTAPQSTSDLQCPPTSSTTCRPMSKEASSRSCTPVGTNDSSPTRILSYKCNFCRRR